MLDVVGVVALVVAGSACLRPRHGLGLVVIAAIAAADAPAMVLPIVHREAAPPSLFYGFVLLFWGPSGMPSPTTTCRVLNILDGNPIARTILAGALALLAMSRAYRRSRPLRPETSEARLWDTVGLCFLFVGLVECMLAVVGVLLRYLAD